jgi:hypothetical protein
VNLRDLAALYTKKTFTKKKSFLTKKTTNKPITNKIVTNKKRFLTKTTTKKTGDPVFNGQLRIVKNEFKTCEKKSTFCVLIQS